MRKRKGGRGGTLSSLLKTRIEGCLHQFPDVDDLVKHLCSRYPDYGRLGERRLSTSVQQALNFLKSPPKSRNITDEEDEAEEELSPGPANKKFKKADSREAKLLQMEAQHRKKNFKFEDDDAEDDDTSYSSTSDDAIFDEKFEPDVDVTKSLLRQSYAKDSGSKAEKNVEMEDGGGKEEKKLIETGKGGNQVKEGHNSVKRGGDMKDKEEFKGIKFKDLGGMTEILDELIMDVLVPLYRPELPKWLGIKPTSGILLHGPPGCGKTKLAHAIANEAAVPFYKISATEVVSGVSGASEENIRELFSKARRTAPSIVFIDEIDAIASKRENLQREMERRIVTQLLTCMDESYQLVHSADVYTKSGPSGNRSGYVLVIGATNRPDAVDAALRRPGRFDREIMIGIPDENARAQILSVLTHNLRLEGSFDFLKIARSTAGFVGADLTALTSKAGNLAMKRIVYERKSKLCAEPVDTEWWKHPWSPEDMEKLNITMSDFEEAAKLVQPSLRREGFSAIPNVKWEDIGGLDSLRKEFKHSIVRRISHPEDDEEFGVELEQGFLLYGPPGCGKTLIAKAVANEAGANFIHIKGPEILNKYVGESELAVRTIFSRARMCSPCILFLDEIDALTTKRGSEGGRVVDSLLNQLLIELDGADNRKGVFVIGATNRPEVIDPALLRPRRLGKLVYVPLPGPNERGSILKALARAKPIDAEVDLDAIARREVCENLSGSDLYKLINEAADAAKVEKRERLLVSSEEIPSTIKMRHFEQALTEISPSVSEKEKKRYEVICKNFRRL